MLPCKEDELRMEVLRLLSENSILKNQLAQSVYATAAECARMLETEGVMLPIVLEETKQDRCARFARAFAAKIRSKFGVKP